MRIAGRLGVGTGASAGRNWGKPGGAVPTPVPSHVPCMWATAPRPPSWRSDSRRGGSRAELSCDGPAESVTGRQDFVMRWTSLWVLCRAP